MESVKLPIDIVAGTNPPLFRWSQMVDTLNGKQVVDHEGALPATVEVAVARLIGVAKQLLYDNAALQGQINGMVDRITSQSEVSSKKVETPQVSSIKKGKGG